MHSATKYLGGHSDLLGGALVVRDQTLFERLYFVQNATGGDARAVRVVPLLARPQDAGTPRPRAVPHGAAAGRMAGDASAGQPRALSRACQIIPATRSPRGKWTAGSARC